MLIDAHTSAVRCIVVLQHNPDTLGRALQAQTVGAEGGDRSETLRLKGPLGETIKLGAEIDATAQLGFPDQSSNAVYLGVHPQLAALETIPYLRSSQPQSNNSPLQTRTPEIAPHTGAAAISTRVARAVHEGLCR